MKQTDLLLDVSGGKWVRTLGRCGRVSSILPRFPVRIDGYLDAQSIAKAASFAGLHEPAAHGALLVPRVPTSGPVAPVPLIDYLKHFGGPPHNVVGSLAVQRFWPSGLYQNSPPFSTQQMGLLPINQKYVAWSTPRQVDAVDLISQLTDEAHPYMRHNHLS